MKNYLILVVLLLMPTELVAGTCDAAWNGDKFMETMRGSSLARVINLKSKNATVASVTVGQVQAFQDAKERISRLSGISPIFLICGDSAVNAFAGNGGKGQVVGVTVGMLKLVDGDPDMAAAVIGHEFTHHDKGHGAAAQSREVISGLLGLIVGVAVESKVQRKTGVSGLGIDMGRIGATLVSRKFDRDQEREADQGGLEYIMRAGFNPTGAIRLARKMNQAGSGGAGLFFDSHPGWSEREQDFRTMIANNPEAQRLASATSTYKPSTSVEPQGSDTIALAPTYMTTDAQKSYADGIAAVRAKDIATAIREFRSAAVAGYAPAQVIVGSLHMRGQGGVTKDEAEAVRLFRSAADQGDAKGQANLGVAYARGAGGLSKDEAAAVKLYRLAADQGEALGQANLGWMNVGGRGGLVRDEAEAARLFRLAADQGNSIGQSGLASLYATGRGGVPKDDVEAVRLLRLAANQEDSVGQGGLGIMYENGRGGLPQDIEAAVSWYRLAARQGMPQAVAALKRLGRQ